MSQPVLGEESINTWWERDAWHRVSASEQVRKASLEVWYWLLEPKLKKERILTEGWLGKRY